VGSALATAISAMAPRPAAIQVFRFFTSDSPSRFRVGRIEAFGIERPSRTALVRRHDSQRWPAGTSNWRRIA
jgi:hypothetical protein